MDANLSLPSPPNPDDVAAAARRLVGKVRRTPVLEIDPSELALQRAAPASLNLKLEQLQHSGTFKARGATNFMLTQTLNEAGVVAASGGNHGAAVAWAARVQGIPATIFVPTIASPAKVDRLRSYGAIVHQIGEVFAQAYEASEAFRIESGATSIHAYNDPVVMAGAGTTGLEFEQQLADSGHGLDTVMVACGGGGLSGGIAAAIGGHTNIVVCETQGTATYASAKAAGQPVQVEVSGLAADSLGASILGSNTFAALERADATSIVVSDDELAQAQAWLWDNVRLMVEPSAAAPLAALLTGRYASRPDEHVGIVVCGANVSLA